MKVDILAIGAHPDDVELACSGTLLKYMKLGKKVGILDLTRGELGTRGTAETRDEEARNAAKFLNVSFRENIAIEDGFFQNNKENLLKIIEVIRYCQPEIVLMNAIHDRHIDHGKGAKLAADACFLSGLIKVETSRNSHKQDPWRPRLSFHYIQDYYVKPDFVIDITEEIDDKVKSMMLYKTQFFNPDSSEPETPISSKEFLEFIKARAKVFGRPIGANYAEGFTTNRYIGVKNIFDLL